MTSAKEIIRNWCVEFTTLDKAKRGFNNAKKVVKDHGGEIVAEPKYLINSMGSVTCFFQFRGWDKP